jgi:hypothetical protein
MRAFKVHIEQLNTKEEIQEALRTLIKDLDDNFEHVKDYWTSLNSDNDKDAFQNIYYSFKEI